MKYGYARVSTNGQAKDGNGLEVQINALSQSGVDVIYKDKFTGMKKHRPEFDKLLQTIESGDTLVVTKLDRIARSTMHGIQIISELLEKGIRIHVLNLGIMDDTPNGKLIRTVLFAFAEWERDMIVERTSEGKQIARLNSNFKEGRPYINVPDFKKYYEKTKSGKLSINDAISALDISRSKWYRLCAKESGK